MHAFVFYVYCCGWTVLPEGIGYYSQFRVNCNHPVEYHVAGNEKANNERLRQLNRGTANDIFRKELRRSKRNPSRKFFDG